MVFKIIIAYVILAIVAFVIAIDYTRNKRIFKDTKFIKLGLIITITLVVVYIISLILIVLEGMKLSGIIGG